MVGGTTNSIAHTGNIGGNNFILVSSGYAINNWYMFTITCDSTIMKLYMNGVLVNSLPVSGSLQTSNLPLLFGRREGITQGFFDGRIDDIGIWNRSLNQEEITRLYLNVDCSDSIIIQPKNQFNKIGDTAVFVINSSDTTAIYNWQSDIGFGFQNLSNAGQYIGVSNDTLIISNVSVNNNNQSFRCIVYSRSCLDTSNVAVLTLNMNVGVDKNNQGSSIKIYPNPTYDNINIEGLLLNENTFINIYDIQGKLVLTKELFERGTIDILDLNNGVYLVKIGEMVQRIVKMQD